MASCGIQPARILVIWDNEDMLLLLQYMLERAGYQVELARSCEDGIAACLRQPPDVAVVCRVMEGGHKGLEFCRRVRAMAELPRFPIIVAWADLGGCTGTGLRGWKESYAQAYDAGANACLGRVFAPDDLLEEVQTLLADPTVTHLVDSQTLRLSEANREQLRDQPSS